MTRHWTAPRAEDHADADKALFTALPDVLHAGRPDLIVSGIETSLASPRVVFAAERARRAGTVVEL